jgi:hypothetical protein
MTPSSIADGTAEREVAGKDLQIEVIVQGFRDATIYLKLGGSRQRLGLAGGSTTSTFRVPWNAQLANSSQAILVAERMGDDAFLESSRIQVTAGARIVWTINISYEVSLEIY